VRVDAEEENENEKDKNEEDETDGSEDDDDEDVEALKWEWPQAAAAGARNNDKGGSRGNSARGNSTIRRVPSKVATSTTKNATPESFRRMPHATTKGYPTTTADNGHSRQQPSPTTSSSASLLLLPAAAAGLSKADAEGLGGLAVMAVVQLLLRVCASDVMGLHVAAAEGDVARIKAEIGLRAGVVDGGAFAGAAGGGVPTPLVAAAPSASSPVQYVDTARWFFQHSYGLEHIRAAVGLRLDNQTGPPGGRGAGARGCGGLTTSTAISLAGKWAMRTLADHWPEFAGDA
jgi:hypothetical protein